MHAINRSGKLIRARTSIPFLCFVTTERSQKLPNIFQVVGDIQAYPNLIMVTIIIVASGPRTQSRNDGYDT